MAPTLAVLINQNDIYGETEISFYDLLAHFR